MYTSIEEAWGGVSGSNLLTTPLKNKLHPIQEKRKFAEQKKIQERDQKSNYQCRYGDMSCGDVVNNNNNYNDMKKQVAMGIQPFPIGAPEPHNYTYSPQYPWHPWARAGYVQYPYQLSAMFYNNPYNNFPNISNQLSMYQQQHPDNYKTPFKYPYGPSRSELPPAGYPYSQDMPKIVENFGNVKKCNCSNGNLLDQKNIRTCVTYLIFFLIALAVILCVFMICLSK